MLIPDQPCGPDWSEITGQEERYEALWEWLAKMTVYARDGWQEAKRLDGRVRELERELLAYQGERALLKQEIESLRRNDPCLNRE